MALRRSIPMRPLSCRWIIADTSEPLATDDAMVAARHNSHR
jgi:hypothetical protein